MKRISKKIIALLVTTILLILIIPFTNTTAETVSTLDPEIVIETPQEGNLYIMGAQFFPLPMGWTVIVGPITLRAAVTGVNGFEVDFYIDGELLSHDPNSPFEAAWWDIGFGKRTIRVELTGYGIYDEMEVFKII